MATTTRTFTTEAPSSSRSRTISLFSSVSSKMRFGSSTKGKAKVVAEGSGETRNKSFLARRLSGGAAARPPPLGNTATPLAELNGAGAGDGMASYRDKMAFTRSSPELDQSAYQAWPTLAIQDEEDDDDQVSHSKPLPIPSAFVKLPRAARASYDQPSIPFTRALSSSPPSSFTSPEEEERRRTASRAEALAKLTEPAPPTGFPFPSSEGPPRPSRLPPPSPLDITSSSRTRWSVEREWLVEDPALRRRRSATADKRERHKSAGEAGQAPRPLFRPILQAPSPVAQDDPSFGRGDDDIARRSASSLSPSAYPIDINLRGRMVRARSSNTTTGSLSQHGHSHDSSGGSDYSPGSSRFTDSTYATTATRRSLDVTSAGPSVTFVERIKGSDREKAWGEPAGNVGSNRIYGDRRLSESATTLGVVEEDVGSRIVQPKRAGLGRQSSSPSPQRMQDTRVSSEAVPILCLDTSSSSPKPRQRHSSDAARPIRLVQRSVSSPIVKEGETASTDALLSRELRRRSTDSYRPWTPSSSTDHLPFPTAGTDTSPATPVSRPRPHKRWGSEVYIDRQPFEQPSPARSRHESLHSPSPSSKGQRVMRTKLVLREDGRPTLTYQLGECIGRGQFGSVYRALNLNSGRVVAVKRISLEDKTEAEVQQLSNEVALLKSLVHPSIVKYEGLVRSEHYLNIILEYVENGSLEKTLKTFGELPEQLVASYILRVLEGLIYLHSQNVVHCDLKAANILTTKTGATRLSDFGVSLNLNALQNQKSAVDQEINGTPYYIAPEVLELKGATTKADIWSLGCVVVELMTTKPPYANLIPASAMWRIVQDPCPPIPEECSPALVDFLRQCFAKDPLDRPTAKDLFAHEWLQSALDPSSHDLRPQDSIPFLHRLSSEMRRPDLAATFEPADPFSIDSTAELRRPILSFAGPRHSFDEPDSPKSSSFGQSVPGSPTLSPTGFSFGDILRSRRPGITPTSSDSSVDTHAFKPSNAFRQLSDLVGVKSRSPEPTPPSSLSKSYVPTSEGSASRGPEAAEPSNPLARKLSMGRPSDLGRRKSHRRTVSQPANKVKTSEDCIVQ